MKNHNFKIGILETGRPPEELGAEFGDYVEMVSQWLEPFKARFFNYAVLDGQLPGDPLECNLWVVTGSGFGVYEDYDWIDPMENFIRDCRDKQVRMVGICFGHQIIAQALGGKVAKSAKGWGLGVHRYGPVNWPIEFGERPDAISMQAYHQDQVEALPGCAVRVAGSEFCNNAVLLYPGFALTVQGHPEFSKPYARALVECRRGRLLSDAEADQAQRDMAHETNTDWFAQLIRDRFVKM